jgi:winged helix DNA-binding protein
MVIATWEDVRTCRVARSALAQRAAVDQLVDVVGDVGGVHAQVQASAELQLASRLDGLTQADVREALWERRQLVKAWTLRGTLHLHPAGELALWHAARRAVAGPPRELAAWRDPAGVLHPEVGRHDVQAIRAAVWDALDGRCLLRDEIADEVVSRVGGAHEERLRSGFAFFLAELCQGPPRGAKVTFVRPDQWDRRLARGRRGPRARRSLPPLPPGLRARAPGRLPRVVHLCGLQSSEGTRTVRRLRRRARRDRRRGLARVCPRRRHRLSPAGADPSAATGVRRLRHGLPRNATA